MNDATLDVRALLAVAPYLADTVISEVCGVSRQWVSAQRHRYGLAGATVAQQDRARELLHLVRQARSALGPASVPRELLARQARTAAMEP